MQGMKTMKSSGIPAVGVGGRRVIPMALSAAGAILGIGLLAAANLYIVQRGHREYLHVAVAQSLLEQGRLLARQLAAEPAVSEGVAGAVQWQEFSRFVRSLMQFNKGLEYVSVAEGGVILYHHSMGPGSATVGLPRDARGEVSVGRQILVSGAETIPVLTFTARVTDAGGIARSVQVALRRDVLDREREAPHAAMTQMYKLSLATISVSFALCVVLVAWLINREVRRDVLRRRQEHLAFAGAMANGIFHDFRNPMSALRLDLQLLKREVDRGAGLRTDRVSDLAERARKTLDRLDAILKEFLHISRPDPVMGSTDLNDCLRDGLDLLSARFVRSGVNLKAELTDEPLAVAGMPTGLKRAVVNVLVNAEQVSPAGSTVRVRSGRVHGQAVVEIMDEGPGVSRADRERIFEMFVSDKPGGMGLGLALARTAIESSGGTIEVDESPGGGARFTIRVPLWTRAARPDGEREGG
jgi:signal transduction histidine kinase